MSYFLVSIFLSFILFLASSSFFGWFALFFAVPLGFFSALYLFLEDPEESKTKKKKEKAPIKEENSSCEDLSWTWKAAILSLFFLC